MKQVLLNRKGVQVKEVPAPRVEPGCLLIKTDFSCLSSGTERSAVKDAGKSIFRRAAEEPRKIIDGLEMLWRKGISSTWDAVTGAAELSSSPGYSLAGTVVEIGNETQGFGAGDRVAAAGSGFASHAEFVRVPQNLVTRIPDNVDSRAAATVAFGAIAMQAVRRGEVRLGDVVVVVGAGLLGQLALQMCRAAGARTIALDIDADRLKLAQEMGAERVLNPISDECSAVVREIGAGHGADVVIFAAQTTDPQVLSEAAGLCRKKGRLVMVGEYGSVVNRSDLYEKEIDFLISCSYGPGRYDPVYEQQGLDYPYAYVRWAERRNMQEYLRLVSTGAVKLDPLIERVYPIEQAGAAFSDLIREGRKPLIVLLSYPSDSNPATTLPIRRVPARSVEGRISVGLAGPGGFARGVHLPNIERLKDDLSLRAVVSKSGSHSAEVAERYGADYASTSFREMLSDPEVRVAMICTRHSTHGEMVLEALQAGKHVFVEKPLCISLEELSRIEDFYASDTPAKPLLFVGFNRRFSPMAIKLKELLASRATPALLVYRMNAGMLPKGAWAGTAEEGGRIIGEACHIIDLFSFLIGSSVRSVTVSSLASATNPALRQENKSITLEYTDGSVGVINYFSVGSPQMGKEWLEAHFEGRTVTLDNYQRLAESKKIMESASPDKGHFEEMKALVSAVRAGSQELFIDLESLFETTRVSIEAASG